MLSKEVLDWLQEQKKHDVDGYLDGDQHWCDYTSCNIREWVKKIKAWVKNPST